MALVGIAVGAALTLAGTRLMQGLIYGVSASDPMTFAVVSGVLGSVALAAKPGAGVARHARQSDGRAARR